MTGIKFRNSKIFKFLNFILIFKSLTCIVLDKLEQAKHIFHKLTLG